ncbi:MAG: hypothetical protein CVV64_16105 [Candidatus Wallbacteria bacterium HGW-Wallbacteria-1]|uniref:Uncharacterized protein n=1 Tax=Candidatus Wallbacteria bacterium HGW-Wallbacteria-1 TaxID=2013854 RepID=A0A2N1PL65_9BACT|nr:MAG: hypothetical protein CVV64_16105 [Candidatus Wallbacteria bacterium HGW-Wallbacteria-1]
MNCSKLTTTVPALSIFSIFSIVSGLYLFLIIMTPSPCLSAPADTILGISIGLEKAGQYEKAISSWVKAEGEVTPHVFHQRLGWLNYLGGWYKTGLDHYLESTITKPGDYNSILGVVNCLMALGRYQEARPILENLFSLNDQDLLLLRTYSTLLYSGGFYKDQINLAIDNPDDPILNTTRGWSYFQQGKYSSARDTFKKLLQDAPQDKTLLSALESAYMPGSLNAGFFNTSISYGLGLPDKTVRNGLLSYSPHKWLSLRGIYSRTTTTDRSFMESSYDLGMTMTFGKDHTFGMDYLWFNNNDALSDSSHLISLQLGTKLSDKSWINLEGDFSAYNQLNVRQFSPRIDWTPNRGWWFQLKGYIISHTGANSPGGNQSAVKLTVTKYVRANWKISGHFWEGEKRLSFESDKVFSFNTLDLYTGGFGFEVAYTAPRAIEIQAGYVSQTMEPFALGGASTTANQITLGLKLRH